MENESLIPRPDTRRIFYAMASIALVIVGLIYFDGIIKPFAIAFLIWFIIHQLQISIGKIRIKGKALPSAIRSILAFAIIFAVIYLVVELLIINIEGIVASMPDYLENFNQSFSEISALINNPKYTEHLQKWINELNISGMASTAVNSISSTVGTSAVVIVYVIFFLLEESKQRVKLEKLFPEKGKSYEQFMQNLRNINESIRSYVWSMTGISLLTGAISYVILLFMQVDYAFLWSFIIFILNFIPYIGPLISSLLPAIFAVLITGNPWQFVYVFAAMEVVQIIIGSFVQPMVMGKGTNLGPVIVILALAFWGLLWGITGMILAVPIASVMVIILGQIPSTRYLAILMSEKGNIPEMEK